MTECLIRPSRHDASASIGATSVEIHSTGRRLSGSTSEKSQLSFSPPPISKETQVEQLLAQGETVPEIAKQTGLKVKEVRKIKRRKKVDEKLPESQQQASSLIRLKQKLFFWQ